MHGNENRAHRSLLRWTLISLTLVSACDRAPESNGPDDGGQNSGSLDLVFSTDRGMASDGSPDGREPKEIAHDGGGDTALSDTTSDVIAGTDSSTTPDGPPLDLPGTDQAPELAMDLLSFGSDQSGPALDDGLSNDGLGVPASDAPSFDLAADGPLTDLLGDGAVATFDSTADSQPYLFAITPETSWDVSGDQGTSMIGAIQKYSVTNNSSTESVTVTAATTEAWLVVTPTSRTLAPNATSTFTLSLTGVENLAAGGYTADTQFTSGVETIIRKTDLHMINRGSDGWVNCSATAVISPGAVGSPSEKGVIYPSVRKSPTGYEAWYVQADVNGQGSLTYATSADGVNWLPSNAVLFTPSGIPSWNTTPHGFTIIEDAGLYKMWLTVTSAINLNDGRIVYLTSADGQNWTEANGGAPVLEPGAGGSWDAYGVREPSVLKRDGSYQMWYSGIALVGLDEVSRIGSATSTDGIIWTKDVGNPTNIGSGRKTYSPRVVYEAGTYRIWYASPSAADPDKFDLWFGFAPTGENWQEANPSSPQPAKTAASLGAWNALGFLHGVSIVRNDETSLRLWYASQPSLASPEPQIGCLAIP